MLNPKRLHAWMPREYKNSIKQGIGLTRRLVPVRRVNPDFLIVGAQKSGTSSLYDYLIRHGSFLRPLLKDIYFFDLNYRKGPDWYRSFYPSESAKRAAEQRIGARVVTGEGATYYLFHPWSPQRVRALLPDIKIVILLRDPVKRAISHYHHNLRFQREALSLEDAFKSEADRIGPDTERMLRDPDFQSYRHQHYSYLARGRYVEQLKRWYEHFPKEQVLVLCSDQFFKDTDKSFRVVCRFLDIPEVSLEDYPTVGKGLKQSSSEKAIEFAREYIRPHNEELFRFLGERYDWL